MGRGSLGDVLPASVRARFIAASQSQTTRPDSAAGGPQRLARVLHAKALLDDFQPFS